MCFNTFQRIVGDLHGSFKGFIDGVQSISIRFSGLLIISGRFRGRLEFPETSGCFRRNLWDISERFQYVSGVFEGSMGFMRFLRDFRWFSGLPREFQGVLIEV